MALRLLCLSSLLAGPALAARPVKTVTVVSNPIYLRKGEVHNAWVEPKDMPKDFAQLFANKSVDLRSFQLDIVRVDADGLTSLPLYDVYNHHHALILGPKDILSEIYKRENGTDPLNPHGHGRRHAHGHGGCAMKGSSIKELLREHMKRHHRSNISTFGGASGAEFRGTSTMVPEPFSYRIWNPEAFMVLLHFINTKGVPHEQKLWECPCTKDRKINVTAGTVDGVKPVPFRCSKQLLEEKNTACSLATYEGGYRCCEHGVFLLEDKPGPDAPRDEIHAKFTFEYYDNEEVDIEDGLRPLESVSCCDATAASGKGGKDHRIANLEYDVPKCAPGTPPEACVHVISSVEPFDTESPSSNSTVDPEEEMELVHAWGHQHVAGLGLELIREATGEVLCRTRPKYGGGTTPGDEAGFVVGIPPCVFGPPPLAPPPRLKRGEMVRTVSRYNSTERHHGVMALWILNAAQAKTSRSEVLV